MPSIPHPPSRVVAKKNPGLIILLLLFATIGAGTFFLYKTARQKSRGSQPQIIEAHVVAEKLLLCFATNGTLHTLAASEGDVVSAGTFLAAQDKAEEIWKTLVAAEHDLAIAQLALPAEYIDKRGNNKNLPIKDQITLLAATEEHLRKKQETASITEAKAGLAYTRSQMLHSKQGTLQKQVDNAHQEYLAAKDSTLYTAMQFEKTSIERAAAEQRLRGIIIAQQKSRVSTVPAALRINNYEIQRDHVIAIRQRFANSTIIAPTDGIISTIFVTRGQTVRQLDPVIAFMPTHHFSKKLSITGRTDNSVPLTSDTACTIRIPAVTNATFTGKVVHTPNATPSDTTFLVEILLDDTVPRLRYLPAEAQVTLIKNED